MKILVVEDLTAKADSVESVIRRKLVGVEASVVRATNMVGALRALGRELFDLLILDLVLPIREGEPPDASSGKRILQEIVAGESCLRPSHIICLTAYEESTGMVREERDRALVHVVLYSESDPGWQSLLGAKLDYIHRRIQSAVAQSPEFKSDVAIITSSPLVELDEVTKLPGGFVAEYDQADSVYYYNAKWSVNDRSVDVVACAAPVMGMTATCVTACKLIERCRPRFLVMTGIAAGTRKDQDYGDVLVAECAYDYGSGKIEEEKDGSRRFVPRPSQLRIDSGLAAVLQRWEREQLRMVEIGRGWHARGKNVPKLILGVLATGAAVIQSQGLVNEILSDSGKVVGLDMEAYAVFHAAHLARDPKPRILVAKSVADFANRDKGDDWQRYAAFTSAHFVYELFTQAGELLAHQ